MAEISQQQFAQRLRAAMRVFRIPGTYLAEAIGANPATISRYRDPEYKSGPPRASVRRAMERALRLPEGYLDGSIDVDLEQLKSEREEEADRIFQENLQAADQRIIERREAAEAAREELRSRNSDFNLLIMMTELSMSGARRLGEPFIGRYATMAKQTPLLLRLAKLDLTIRAEWRGAARIEDVEGWLRVLEGSLEGKRYDLNALLKSIYERAGVEYTPPLGSEDLGDTIDLAKKYVADLEKQRAQTTSVDEDEARVLAADAQEQRLVEEDQAARAAASQQPPVDRRAAGSD